VVLLGYGSDVGRGFVKEDATWIMQSRVNSARDLSRIVAKGGGFFRPVVALSFAANYWVFGGSPRGYGWTNLALAIASGLAIFLLARSLGLSDGGSLLAAALWILNFHGINMAVLWLSGRTALLLGLFGVLAGVATARNRLVWACLFALLAMLSKEEGVLLPIALAALLVMHPREHLPPLRVFTFVVGFVAIWGVYAALRMQSDAMTPSNAPPFYTFGAPPWSFRKNLTEYADRSLTFPLGVTTVALAIAGRVPRLQREHQKIVAVGIVWLVTGFGLTMFLPARSSLYAVFPSVGGAIACATIVSAAWPDMSPTRRRRTALAAMIVPFLLVPVYWRRNVRWTELAAVSRDVVSTFAGLARTAPAQWEVIVMDDRSTRTNIAASVALPDAVELSTGRRPHVWMVPPFEDMEPKDFVMAPARADAVVALRAGRIVRVPLTEWTPAPASDWP
jgi:hypothetical protein